MTTKYSDSTSNADAVEAIDSRLRSLYRCFRDFGPNNSQVITTVRQLHGVLKELRVEALKSNGPLNTASPAFSGAFSRQLALILEECDVSLSDFATIVEKFRPSLALDSRSNSFGSITSAGSNSSSDISGHSFSTTPVSAPVNVTVSGSPLGLAFFPPPDYVGQTTDDQLAVVRSRFVSHATRLASLLETMNSPAPPYPSAASGSQSHATLQSPSQSHSPTQSPASPRSPPHSPSHPNYYFHSSSPTHRSSPHISPPISPMPSDEGDIEIIKDRIDAIALRLAHQDDLVSAAQFSTASIDQLWKVFSTELGYEGFSDNTLSEHKCALRPYIQELGSRGFFKGNDAPSPRLPPRDSVHSLPTYMVPGQAPCNSTFSSQGNQLSGDQSPKEVVQPIDSNEKYHQCVKDSRLVPQSRETDVYIPYRSAPASSLNPEAEPKYIATPPESVASDQHLALTPSQSPNTTATRANIPRTVPMQHHSSSLSAQLAGRDLPSPPPRDDSEESYNVNGFNCITTKRLLEIDWYDRERAAGRLGVTYTPPQLLEYGGHSPQNMPALPASPSVAAIVRQNSLQSQLSLSPSSPSRLSFFPPSSAGGIAPPPYHYNASVPNLPAASQAAFGIMIPGSTAPSAAPQTPELGPDSFGRPIPADAIWTRITRKRISPEVLTRAGVRFEARPSFVAILGVLSREQIAEYARQSVEVRRSWRHSTALANVRDERPSPVATGTSPPGHSTRPERRQTMPGSGSGSGSDKSERESSTSLRAQTFPLSSSPGSPPGSKERGRETDDIPIPEKGGSYPFIVSPPATEVDTSGAEGTSAPKSILKNKNKNKVRYRDGELVEVSPDEDSRSHRHGRRHRSKSRAKSRHRDSDSRLDIRRDSSRHRDDDRDRDHRRDRDRSRKRDDYGRDSNRDRERERERERDRDRDLVYDRTSHRSRHKDSDRDSSRRRHRHDDRSYDHERDDARHRDRDRSRDRSRDRESGRHRDRDRRSHGLSHSKSSYNLSSRTQRDGRDGRDGRDRRDRDRDRDHDSDSREREDGRKRLRDTISAAGIGGVAGSFFSVLTEAASGF